MEQLLLTIEDTQTVVPVGRTKLYELIARGQLQRVKIGRKPFITAASVRDYVARLSEAQAS